MLGVFWVYTFQFIFGFVVDGNAGNVLDGTFRDTTLTISQVLPPDKMGKLPTKELIFVKLVSHVSEAKKDQATYHCLYLPPPILGSVKLLDLGCWRCEATFG